MPNVLTNPIKVLIVDGQRIVLAGLKLLIESDARYQVSGIATNREEALEQIGLQEPDVIVLELVMGEDNGLYIIPILQARCKANILILTGSRNLPLHDQAVIAGARGVISKDEPPQTLLSAIEKIHQGELWVNRNATARILLEIAKANAPKTAGPEEKKLASLTKKEEKVLQAVVASSDKQLKVVADGLCISQHTLRNHLAAIYEKLGVTSRLELYVYWKKYSAVKAA
jgi:DNA-binding NarL/FixJ family response regulator